MNSKDLIRKIKERRILQSMFDGKYINDVVDDFIEDVRKQERERIIIKLEKLQDDAKKYPAKYHPDFPEKSNGYNEGFNQAMRDVIDIIKTLNQ